MSKCPAMTGPIHEKGECLKKEYLDPPKAPCYDWLVVSGDAHYARDRSAFKTYHQIEATVGGVKVIGIGTVELMTQVEPDKPTTRLLTINNVLHIPSARCNGYVSELVDRDPLSHANTFRGLDMNAEQKWHGTSTCGSTRVRIVLDGNPQGESVLEEDKGMGRVAVFFTVEEFNHIKSLRVWEAHLKT